MSNEAGDLWVFAYGSLMWRPDFEHVETRPARLSGWHRRFCIVSRHFRGTANRPGLILGLARGGHCEGIAFRVSAEKRRDVLRYLRAREQISGVYREALVTITVLAEARSSHTAVTFLAEPAHPSFLGRLPIRRQAHIITGARGKAGTNLEYLVNTIRELKRLSIRERELERILAIIGSVRAAGRTRRGPGNGAVPPARVVKDWPRGSKVHLSDVKRFNHRLRLG